MRYTDQEMRESLAAISAHFYGGVDIQIQNDGQWTDVSKMLPVRVKPVDAAAMPSIDWSQVHPAFLYLTADNDNDPGLWTACPRFADGTWHDGGKHASARTHASFVAPKRGEPAQWIVERPDNG